MKQAPLRWANAQEKAVAFQNAQNMIHEDPREFWRLEAARLTWAEAFHTVHDGGFADGRWFLGGKLNVSVNCLDRHLPLDHGEKIALYFENERGQTENVSYKSLHALTCQVAALLHDRGIRQGDRVAIYMPMNKEAIASMLACARLGAVHTVVFGGFSKDALADRICDSEAKAVITSEGTERKGQTLQLRKIVMEAASLSKCSSLKTIICFGLLPSLKTETLIPFRPVLDWPFIVKHPEAFDAEHPLFILYTSGTTGKPKGIFHSTGGYLTQVVSTMQWVFDLSEDDVYWCTADIGWITGHSYVTYGPLASGKSIFVYDGALNWPDISRIYQLIDKHQVTVLYTAPTAIRMFMKAGDAISRNHALSSLRLLGSVGEPINPEAWSWYRRVFGKNRCPVIDSWWQTETGAMMITPMRDLSRQKPGSASTPFFGISAKVVDEKGHAVECGKSGFLVIDEPWPSMARGIWNDKPRFLDTYFKKFPHSYFTGDGAKMDSEGDFFISGRIDDVVNVSGHRLGTAEIESALVAHKFVAEAAVVGVPDELTGQKLVAFLVLIDGYEPSQALTEDLKDHVKGTIGSFAKPAAIYFEKVLPKTRSGKIMRRLLRAKAAGEPVASDVSTLDDATST